MRRLATALLVLVASTVTWVGAATPAWANTIDTFTLSASSVLPGDTVTATATWTATDAASRDLSVVFPAGLGASWTSASTAPVRNCVTDAPPTDAACLWNAHVSGDTITLTAVLTVAADATPGTYDLTAAASPVDSNGTLTRQLTVLSDSTPAISVAPTSATPGSSAVATGTFTALTTGDIRVGVFLTGTSGNGTFGTATDTTGLTNCVLNASARAFDCLWSGAVVGQTRTIVIPVTVGAGATAGQSWTVQACSNANTPASACDSTPLAIIAAPVTGTPSPTASAPSATVSPETTPSTTDAALPTAVPAGEGPIRSTNPLPWIALLVALSCAALLALLAPRRGGQHR
jgi:hypothetical protein